MSSPTILFTEASFAWPDGTSVLDRTTAAFGAGRTGLVGDNGVGKTTVLRLVAGQLRPTSGSVSAAGEVAYLPQLLSLQTEETVADLLGVRATLDALRAIESGAVEPLLFDEVGSDWDLEARAAATLDELGVHGVGLDRPVGRLSGGETMLVALAGLRLGGAPVVLLDEPTNNLDRAARQQCYDAVVGWAGALVVVSHDVTLLDLMDDTAELRGHSLSVFGGPFGEFRRHVEQEQEAAEQALRTAEQSLKKEQRQRREAESTLARRQRYARTDFENKRKPKIVMNMRRAEAQVSAGKLRADLDDRVGSARRRVADQEARIRADARIRIQLPDPDVPAARRLAELRDGDRVVVVQGPERVALTGRNGVGKTVLLETLFTPPAQGSSDVYAIPLTSRIGYLPQRLDGLDDAVNAVDSVRAVAPDATAGEIRAQLARFLLRGDDVHRPVGSLSGGERFRVALARILLARPAHQLLVLDEPTNNLDLTTVQVLVDALAAYRGGLLVVSHDDGFLAELGIDTWLTLTAGGRLVSSDHEP
jgi:ATPase subunit of ABC transporter with duplicated ATPase domains